MRATFPDDPEPTNARKRPGTDESSEGTSKRPRAVPSSKKEALGGSAVGSKSGRNLSMSGTQVRLPFIYQVNFGDLVKTRIKKGLVEGQRLVRNQEESCLCQELR